MSFANVGRRWSGSSLVEYLWTLPRPDWAKSVTIHHCWAPSLAQRPSGFSAANLESLRSYYRNTLGWSRGPHFFTDEDDIYGMTPPTTKGTHAVSFNSSSIGFEMLGNYDSEDPKSGRGLAVCLNTAAAARSVLDWLRIPVSEKTVLFHRDDPKTSKTCPGRKIEKAWFCDLVRNAKPGTPAPEVPQVEKFAPVVKHAMALTGRPYSEIARLLRRDGKLYLLNGSWLERAYYDSARGETMAPETEIAEALGIAV